MCILFSYTGVVGRSNAAYYRNPTSASEAKTPRGCDETVGHAGASVLLVTSLYHYRILDKLVTFPDYEAKRCSAMPWIALTNLHLSGIRLRTITFHVFNVTHALAKEAAVWKG